MGKPGPKPKPTNLRVLDGDHHKSRYNLDEPKFDQVDYTPPPAWMEDIVAREMWDWAMPRLIRVGVMTDGDTKALEALCVSYSKWRDTPGTGTFKQFHTMMCEFGLTPSSRTRLVGNLPHESAADPIAARLAQ